MVSTLAQRIAEILKHPEVNGNQSKLGRIAGKGRASVGQWLKHEKPTGGISHEPAMKIERKLGFRAEWIMYGEFPKLAPNQSAEDRAEYAGDLQEEVTSEEITGWMREIMGLSMEAKMRLRPAIRVAIMLASCPKIKRVKKKAA